MIFDIVYTMSFKEKLRNKANIDNYLWLTTKV